MVNRTITLTPKVENILIELGIELGGNIKLAGYEEN